MSPAAQATLPALLGALVFASHASKSVEDLVLFHLGSGKRDTSISPTRLSVLRSEGQLLS